jgi:peroxiredoxin
MANPNLNFGDRILDFDLPGVDGKNYSQADFSDAKAVILFFSCNHCPYVQAWEDRLISIQADYADQGIRLVAVNSNSALSHPADSFEKMVERHRMKGMNFPYLRDEKQEVAINYGAQRTPEIFLFDGEGLFRYHGAPDDNCYEPENVKRHYLRDAIDAVLAGKEPEPAFTPPMGCTIKWK